MKIEISVGDDIVIGPQKDERRNALYRGYVGRVIKINGDYALVDSDAIGRMQSVSFKAWLPIRTFALLEK